MPYRFNKSSSLYLTGTQATRTYVHGLMSSVYNCLYLSYVRLPAAVGLTVGVGYIVSEHNSLSANITLCHYRTPPILCELFLLSLLEIHTLVVYHIFSQIAIDLRNFFTLRFFCQKYRRFTCYLPCFS